MKVELLKEVAAIGGKPGLYKIIKPSRSGVIIETLDKDKKKEMVGVNSKVSLLKDISIYKESSTESTPLSEILESIYKIYGKNLDIDPKTASSKELSEFFEKVMPDYDKEKVYDSDIKKIISWYQILLKEMPEVFEEEEKKPKKVKSKD